MEYIRVGLIFDGEAENAGKTISKISGNIVAIPNIKKLI